MTAPGDDKKPDPEEPARTVFMPSGSLPEASPPAATGPGAEPVAPSTPDNQAEDAWFAGEEAAPVAPPPSTPTPTSTPPSSSWDDTPVAAAPAQDWTPPPPPAAPPLPPAPPPSRDPAPTGGIAIGMVLNHIYEVRRYIARGGMGEVYEGVNVNTDERVAIKVILPHLAADPSVVSMFRKEARTLTRLSHPALVQYRVLAQEPTLGVLYIVTEFIDGAQLGDTIGKIHPDAAELEGLLRRLASGLAAAHALGAIHRDMAPDNVLLPDGRLDQATIIDFGIAKDLDPTNKTIVGDGFAGKLGFVAPEQFGDYDREVGPWTDVYSLALVLLAVANGKPVDMGATLVEAIDRRRAGPDLSGVPDRLRPVFAGMLKPNPAERFRSMAEVLEALDRAVAQPGAVAPVAKPAPAPQPAKPPVSPGAKPPSSPLPLILGLIAVLVVAGAAAFFVLSRKPATSTPSATQAAATAGASPVRGSERVRQAVEAALPGIACSWIDIDTVTDDPNGVTVKLSGVAGSPVEAQGAISKAAQATGAPIGLVDASNVFPAASKTCAELDAFRGFREPSSEHGRSFVTEQSKWQLMTTNPPCDGPNAKAIVKLHVGDPSKDFSVIGMDKDGLLQQVFASRSVLKGYIAQLPNFFSQGDDDSFTMTSCYNETGLVGELLVSGQGPFNVDLPDISKSNLGRPVDAKWLQNFTDSAKAKGWKTDMVWYQVVSQ